MFSRSIALLGEESMAQLQSKRVILFGIGGVGSWCAETLIRTGLTHLTIVDGDIVQPSNINRQLPATQATIGMPKVDALKERLLAINPEAEIIALNEMVNSEWLQTHNLAQSQDGAGQCTMEGGRDGSQGALQDEQAYG